MEIKTIEPRDCTKWKFANRSSFEYGAVNDLADDIKKNGQIEPIYVRKLSKGKFKYEVIAGSRRFQACLNTGLQLKAYICDVSDKEALIIQDKENDKLPISDYSKGILYHKIQKSLSLTQIELANTLGISKRKLQNYLSFAKVDPVVWEAISNMSRVSAKSAEIIYLLCKKSTKHKDAILDIVDEIRKGAGGRKIEQMVNNIVKKGTAKTIPELIETDKGLLIGGWKNNSIVFSKKVKIDKGRITKLIIAYFNNPKNKK